MDAQPSIILQVFVMAMLYNPDVWKTAQAEMDKTISATSVPTSADDSRLPYLRAVQLEVQRWKPVVPLSMFAGPRLRSIWA